MDERIGQRKVMVDFWRKSREMCCTIRSIDAVYEEFMKYYQTVDALYPPINKYIFRTYIRKPENGYQNTSAKTTDAEGNVQHDTVIPKKRRDRTKNKKIIQGVNSEQVGEQPFNVSPKS
jgi:hypothetical protein